MKGVATPFNDHEQLLKLLAKSLRVKSLPQNTDLKQALGQCIAKVYELQLTNFEAGPYHLRITVKPACFVNSKLELNSLLFDCITSEYLAAY